MNLGILLWNTCNAKCAHCAVNSSPTEVGYMTDEQIFALIDSTFYDHPKPSIGLSGGEAFLYFERLCTIVEYATKRGATVSVNTNGFWGTTVAKATTLVRRLKAIRLQMITVSVDDFHEAYIPRKRVLNVIRACKDVYLEVRVQFVSTKKSRRLADFLKDHGDELLDVECREIPCHPVGRAARTVPSEDLFFEESVPEGLCPSSVLSVSAYGKVIPCCNTAGHLPALQVGTVAEPLPDLHRKFLNDPVLRVLRLKGPRAFLKIAEEAGYTPRYPGYVNQCHLCHELFRNRRVAEALRDAATAILDHDLYDTFWQEYQNRLERQDARSV